MTLRSTLVASASMALLGAGAAVAPSLAGAAIPVKPVQVYAGTALVSLDPAVTTPLGLSVEGRPPSRNPGNKFGLKAAGVKVKVVGGVMRLRGTLRGQIRTVGGFALTRPDPVVPGVAPTKTKVTFNWPSYSFGSGRKVSTILGVQSEWGDRSTWFKFALPAGSVKISAAGTLTVKNAPLSLTAVGAAGMNAVFGNGAAPFVAGQQIGTTTLTTRWYLPGARRARR
jgi:hypothetical protein